MPTTPPPPFDPFGIHDRLHVRLLAMRRVTISSDSSERWTWDDMRNSYWRLYVNREAGAWVIWENERIKLEPGCVFLVPAWVRFSSRCNADVDHLYFHFDIVGLGSPLVREWFDRPIGLPPDKTSEDLSERIRAALRKGQHDDMTTAFAAKSLINLAVARLFDSLEHGDGTAPGKKHFLLRHLAELTPVLPALRRIDTSARATRA